MDVKCASIVIRTRKPHKSRDKWMDIIFYTIFSKVYINFLDAKIISNENVASYKLLDLVEHYNNDADLFLCKIIW